MDLAEAEALAARIVAAIERDEAHAAIDGYGDHYDADRERVASDLRVIRWAAVGPPGTPLGHMPDPRTTDGLILAEASANLRRTAALYGVVES
jgi:hypothetical protein